MSEPHVHIVDNGHGDNPCKMCLAREAELAALQTDLDVAHQIGDTFWEALKPLKLQAINVANPGQHVTDLIERITVLEADARRLREAARPYTRIPEADELRDALAAFDIAIDHRQRYGEAVSYNIKEIHYRDKFGALLWTEPMIFKRLWDVGGELVHDYKSYTVLRVAIADSVQHVNVEPAEQEQTNYGETEDPPMSGDVEVTGPSAGASPVSPPTVAQEQTPPRYVEHHLCDCDYCGYDAGREDQR